MSRYLVVLGVLAASVVLTLAAEAQQGVSCLNTAGGTNGWTLTLGVSGAPANNGCNGQCGTGKKCMRHAFGATIFCNANGGNMSCNYCIYERVYVGNGPGPNGVVFPNTPTWTQTVNAMQALCNLYPSPVSCTTIQGGTQLISTTFNNYYLDGCETDDGLYVRADFIAFNQSCQNITNINTANPDAIVSTYYNR